MNSFPKLCINRMLSVFLVFSIQLLPSCNRYEVADERSPLPALGSENGSSDDQIKQNNNSSSAQLGLELYEQKCQACHQSFSENSLKNKDSQGIIQAIKTVPVMKNLDSLSNDQVVAISKALIGSKDNIASLPSESDILNTSSGLQLYKTYCESCHLPIESNNINNSNSEGIKKALIEINVMNSNEDLKKLNDEAIKNISEVLSSNKKPPSPPAKEEKIEENGGILLYATYCEQCHSPLLESKVKEATASSIKSAIENVTVMNSLRSLSDTEIQEISASLTQNSDTE